MLYISHNTIKLYHQIRNLSMVSEYLIELFFAIITCPAKGLLVRIDKKI